MSFLSLFSRVFGSRTQPTSNRRRRSLVLEGLEDRTVPAVFNVNSLADILSPAAGVVTLRSAIQQANQTPGGNTINLTVAGTYQLTLPGTAGEADNAAGELAVLPTGGNLSIINTSGGAVAVSAGGASRVLDINPLSGTTAPKFTVTLQGFTIENGFATDANNPDGPNASGGGIRDQGNASLTLNDVAVLHNTASADGGGISMENIVSTPWTLDINNSTINFNRAGDAGGGVDEDGGGHVNITGSVINNNSATNQGAGVWLDAIAPGTITTPVVNPGGSGYTSVPTVVFTNAAGDTTGMGAAGTAVVSNGQVTGIVLTSSGTGYTLAPKISFTGGGGTGAAATTTVNQQFTTATLNITTSTIDGNTALAADNFGGGVGNAGNATVTITSSTLAGNFVNGNGGGFGDQNGIGTLVVLNSTIANNSALADGGGVFENTANTTTIEDTTITGNNSLANAGGVEILNGNLVLNNTIVAGNFAGPMNFVGGVTAVTVTNPGGNPGVFGGGTTYTSPPTVVFTNAAGDTTGNGAAATATITNGMVTAVTVTNAGTGYQLPPLISFTGGGGSGAAATATIAGAAPNILATVSTGSGNFIGSGDLNLTGLTNGTSSNQIGTRANPLNPLLGPLQNNGGPTFTEAALPGSPVINKGVNTAVPINDPITTTALTDQRGLVRIVGGTVDIGAVEFQTVQPTVTLTASVTTVTTTTLGGLTFAETVTLTATITPPVGGNGPPTGTVTFFDGTVALNATPVAVSGNGTATFQLTVLPAGASLVGGQSLTAVYTPDNNGTTNGYIQSTSKPLVVVVGTPAELVLNQLFEDLLRRSVNAGDLQFWIPQLGDQSNPASQAAQTAVQKVSLGILQSHDYIVQEIDALFLNYLGRTAGTNDLNFWVPQFQKGITLEQAAIIFVTSPEFISKNGGTSDNTVNGIPSQQLITALFQDALGRAPQQKDFTSVQGQTLQQLVNNIFSSPEYEGHSVDVFYQDYLRRTAQGNEANYWMTFYPGSSNAGMVPSGVQPDVYIISGFIGSQEYIQNAINNPLGQNAVPTNPLQASI